MNLLLVSPQGNTTARISAALRRHPELAVSTASHAGVAGDLAGPAAPDILLMVSHPNVVHWEMELRSLGWTGTTVLLVPSGDDKGSSALLHRPDVVCLEAEAADSPFFPSLLEHLGRDDSRKSERTLRGAMSRGADPGAGGGGVAETVNEAISSLTKSLDVQSVLDRLLSALLDLIRCDGADVRLVDGDQVQVIHTYGYPRAKELQSEPVRFSLADNRNLLQAATGRRAVRVPDTASYEGWIPKPGAEWIRSHLTAPLLVDDALIGFLDVSSAAPHAFTDSDCRTLEALAPLASVALHNARLYQALSRERDQLMALASIDQQILTMSESPQVVVRTVLGHALRLLGLPKGISILAPYTGTPELVHTHGVEDVVGAEQLIQANWAYGRSLCEAKGPGWHLGLNEMPADLGQFGTWLRAEHIQALLAMPFWLQGKLVGMILLFDTHSRPWDKDRTRVAEMLANQATIAIDKAMLTQKLRQRLHAAEEAILQLQRFDGLKSQFIQNVSHELRTPLAIVKGYVDLIAEGTLYEQQDPSLGTAIQAIHTHTNNLIRLVDSITTLGDVDVGRLNLTPQPLQPICTAALRATWQQALRRNITIVAEIPDELPTINLDAQGMLRALNHVLDNAIKFSQEGGNVRFRVLEDDGQVWLRVEDDGIGIPPMELDHVFIRFYQVHGESTRRHGGLGIGLALVKEVVENHRGEVWAESPGEGLGTTILIKLPIDRATADSGRNGESA